MTREEYKLGAYDPPGDLKKSSVRSGSIHLASRFVFIALNLVSMMVLARLLRPSDFGVYAMAMTVLLFMRPFKDLGLGRALVNKQRIGSEEIDILFRVTLLLHITLAVIIAITAPLLAWFYSTDALLRVIPVMALVFTLSAFSIQPESILARRMEFGMLNAVQLVGTLLSMAAAMVAAWYGLSYWALVIQYAVSWGVRSIGIWMVCPWRPSWGRLDYARWSKDVRGLMQYGSELTGARIVAQLGKYVDRVLVGYVGGAAVLGIYDKARKWAYGPAKNIHVPLMAVGVSGLSRLQGEPKKYRGFLRVSLMCNYAVILPILAFMWVEANNLVLFFLGDQWGEMVPYIRLFCVGGFFGMITRTVRWVYLSEGRTRRQLQWSLIATPAEVLAIAIGLPWGPPGIALAACLSMLLLVYPSMHFCFSGSIARASDMMRAYWRPAVTSMLAAIGLLATGPFLPGYAIVAASVALALTIFLFYYVAVWVALPGGWKDLKMIVRVVRSAWTKQKVELVVAADMDSVSPTDVEEGS